MNTSSFTFLVLSFFIPVVCNAGEPSKGTVIMISSVSGWLLLSSGFFLWKEIRKERGSQSNDK